MPAPSWLPASLCLNPIPRDIHDFLYEIFERDFINGVVRFSGLPVWWDRRQTEEYPEGFWHVISRHDYSLDDRVLDTRRAEKLPWCAAIINNHHASEVSVFDHREGDGRIKTYLWLEQFDYLVILEKRSVKLRGRSVDVMWLVTAYHVDDERSRAQLRKKRARGV